MTSIVTNTSAMAALQTLRSTFSDHDKVQQQMSSGLRVFNASDNAAYWSIATTMRSEKLAMSAASDSIGLSKSILDVTYNGLEEVRSEMTKIRDLAISASNAPPPAYGQYTVVGGNVIDQAYEASSVGKIDAEMRQHWAQIMSTVKSSSFAGVNLLTNTTGPADLKNGSLDLVTGYADGHIITSKVSLLDTVVINYKRTADAVYSPFAGARNTEMGYSDGALVFAVGYQPITQYNTSSNSVEPSTPDYLLLYGEQNIAHNNPQNRSDWYESMVNDLDTRLSALTNGMANVGALQKSVDMADDFNVKLQDTLAKGIGRLVDADMNEVSAKAKALETKQQLSIQTLNIANQSPNTILTLFKS